MMNGSDLNGAISSKEKGTVALTYVTKKTPKAIMDHLYLTALNRLPTPNESERILRHCLQCTREVEGRFEHVAGPILGPTQ